MRTRTASTWNGKWLICQAALLAWATEACAGREAATVAAANTTKQAQTCSLEGKNVVVPLISSSSSVALASVGTDTVAFIADEDARRVYAVDVDTKAELGYVDLEQPPSNLLIAKSGRVAVTSPKGSKVEVLSFDGKTLAHVCAVPTDAEPLALALTPDERTLLVTSGWGHSLAAFKSADMQQLYRVDLPREPRAVVTSDDGTRAFVSHALGSVVSAVDLGARKPTLISLDGGDDRSARQARQALQKQLEAQGQSAQEIAATLGQSSPMPHRLGSQGFALAKTTSPPGRILAPQVLVDPGRADQRTQGYGQDDDETQIPSVAVLDAHALKPLESSLEVRNSWARAPLLNGDTREECVLPRSAAVDPTSGALLVTCMGSDLVLGLDAASAAPADAELFRVRVATGPTGVAVDAAHGRAVVWSQFERVLNVLKLPGAGPVGVASAAPEQIALSKVPAREPSLDFRLGRRLFFASGDPRIAKDGRACASCHIDGRDDGLVWATPNGPRRTKVLAGLVADTAPYSWDGEAHGLRDQVGHTFERLRGVGGLRGIELDALLGYVSALPPPPSATELQPESLAERGALVFASKQAGCAECHTGKRKTDGHLHDVATRTDADRAGAFDTPSLDRISARGPYFHDGRYATLRELLEKSAGTMGQIQPLPAKDLDALESFLRTL